MPIDLKPYEDLDIVVNHSQLKQNMFFVYHKGLGMANRCTEDDLESVLEDIKAKVEHYLWHQEELRKLKSQHNEQN